MKKSLRNLTVGLALCLFATPGNATIYNVTASDYVFTPNNFTAYVGDTIVWTWINGVHNTVSLTIPGSATPWNAPLDANSISFSYVVTATGSYTYHCSFHQNMIGSFDVEFPVNIEELKSELWTIKPIPATNALTITGQFTPKTKLAVTNAYGQLVAIQPTEKNSESMRLDVSAWAPGMYFLIIQTEGDRMVKQFIVQ